MNNGSIKVAGTLALGVMFSFGTASAALAMGPSASAPDHQAASVESSATGKEVLIKALRKGGPVLAAFLSQVNEEAGKWVKENAHALADYLESHDVSHEKLVSWLTDRGVPRSVADDIADFVMFIYGSSATQSSPLMS